VFFVSQGFQKIFGQRIRGEHLPGMFATHVVHGNRVSRPDTIECESLKDVPAFLEAHRLAKRSPGERLLDDLKARDAGLEIPITRAKSQGRVKRMNLEDRPSFELAGRELKSWSRVLVKVGAHWQEGTFRFTGDGGKIVEPHVMVNAAAGMVGHRVFVTQHTVLRWPD
jgi:hypothetical protein